jgi:hypothetical protein
MNNKGFTLTETLIAGFIFIILITGIFSMFVSGKRLERVTDSKFFAYNYAGNILENLYRYLGTGDIGGALSQGEHIIKDEVTNDLSYYFLEDEPLMAKTKPDLVKYDSIDYSSIEDEENVYRPLAGVGVKDGFRKVTVTAQWGKEEIDEVVGEGDNLDEEIVL